MATKLRRIVAALDRDEPDRAGHARVGDADDGGRGVHHVESPSGSPTCVAIARFAASTSSDVELCRRSGARH